MKTFCLLSLFILVKADEIDFEYYYTRDGIDVIRPSSSYDTYIDRVPEVVIYLGKIFHVDSVEILEISGILEVSTMFDYDETDYPCRHIGSTRYECNRLAKSVIVKGGAKKRIYKILGKETNIERYAGCFKSAIAERSLLRSRDCKKACRSIFYGLSEDPPTCYCVHNLLDRMVPVELKFCNSICFRDLFCVNGSYYPLYQKKAEVFRDRHRYKPSMACLSQTYKASHCPPCPLGRSGPTCDVINCSISNGGCGDRICTNFKHPNKLIAGTCLCGINMRKDNYLKCKDYDACFYHPCGHGAKCITSDGIPKCQCHEGLYPLDEFSCADLDECLYPTSCDQNSTTCKNLRGSYECLCKEGFVRTASTSTQRKCQDIDECLFKCPNGTRCINYGGSYDCFCPNGTKTFKYVYSTECDDIDECLKYGICDEESTVCINIFNSYKCICRQGYQPFNNFRCVPPLERDKRKTTTWDYYYDDNVTAFSEDEPEVPYERYLAYTAVVLLSGAGVGAGAYFSTVDWSESSPMVLSVLSMVTYK